jgi:hypothetical protein
MGIGIVGHGTGAIPANRWVPKWNGDGQLTYNMVALSSAIAKVWMEYVPTDSGMGCYAVVSTRNARLCVPLEGGASGSYVECAISGYIPDVSAGSSGKVSTASFGTYTKGDKVWMTDTGHILPHSTPTTWTAGDWLTGSTEAGTTAKSMIGVALSSGATTTLDVWFVDKGNPLPSEAAS